MTSIFLTALLYRENLSPLTCAIYRRKKREDRVGTQLGRVKVKGQRVKGQDVLCQAGLALSKSLQAEVAKEKYSTR